MVKNMRYVSVWCISHDRVTEDSAGYQATEALTHAHTHVQGREMNTWRDKDEK